MNKLSVRIVTTTLFALSGGVCLAGDQTHTDDFENGRNDGGWYFIDQGDTIETSGGNPGAWLHQPLYDTFAPILKADSGPYVGDYRAMGVTSMEMDARTDAVSIGCKYYPFAILLRDTKGTDTVDDDDYAYTVHANECPQPGQGWVHYNFDIPSQSTDAVPAGWKGGWVGDAENFRSGVDWNDVITSVDRVEVWWFDPAWFGIFQQFDVGAENLTIHTQPPGQLQLSANPPTVQAGDTLSLTACPGHAGSLCMLTVVDINTAPVFWKMATGTFDANGEFNRSYVIPPGLAGLDLGLQAFGFITASELVASNRVAVSMR